MDKKTFVECYWQAAKDACNGTPIFPELALAEAAVESAWGESQLTVRGNNLFGVKAYPDWRGEFLTMHTKEYHADGTPYYVNAPFKKYDGAKESFEDYVKVVTGPRYAAKGVETAADAAEQIREIAAAGYSTSPTYALAIIAVIDGLKAYL